MFKCLLVATLIASLIFLIIDVIWLSFATKSFYRPLIGNLLNDKPDSLRYTEFIPFMVSEMKKNKIEMDKMRAEIDELKARLDSEE